MKTIEERIRVLRAEKDAIILAHNYTLPEVQDLADFVGDSLELALRAAAAGNPLIVFCGVHFMAETAKILNPRATVLMPDPRAGCPMADMATAEQVRRARVAHPGCAVICYVNTSAAVKAEADVCCTSANAPAVVAGIPEERRIVFVPDRHLASWVSEVTGRELIPWSGFCPTHARILPEHLREARTLHPAALAVAHPECSSAVRALADHVAGTSGILEFCREANHSAFIIATEQGLLHRLSAENPGKRFFAASTRMTCPNMKLSTAEALLWCLEDESGEVTVGADVASRARGAIEHMLAVPRMARAS